MKRRFIYFGSPPPPPLPLILGGGNYSLYTDYTQAWGWGYNLYGQLGNNDTDDWGSFPNSPVTVCGDHTFCHISGGIQHLLAIDHSGQAWGWGYNFYGQIGDGTSTNRHTPVRVCNL